MNREIIPTEYQLTLQVDMARRRQTITRRTDADRRQRQSYRVARHISLLTELLRGNLNLFDLLRVLEPFGVRSTRVVYRDLRVLRDAGVLIHCIDGFYSVGPGFSFPNLPATKDELIGQTTAAIVSQVSGLSIGCGADAITNRIERSSSAETKRLLHDVRAVTHAIDLKLAGREGQDRVIAVIQEALVERRKLLLTYQSPERNRPKAMTIHPGRLCLVRQAWYLIARPDNQPDWFLYKVPRIRDVKLCDAVAEVPEDFDLAAYFGNAWWVYRGGESYRVVLEFSKEAAQQVTETVWHRTQEVRPLSKGRVELRFIVDGLEEILWWLLPWAGFIKVHEPAELKAAFVQQLQSALKQNQ